MMDIVARDLFEWDPSLFEVIEAEKQKQENYITLIASENYITPRLLKYFESTLLFNNEYAEGYPKKRYYGGCDYVDQVETLAIERAKQLFDVEYANVQPHSGSQANAAVFMSLLSPSDCFLAMKLSHGGHLTHGASVNFSGHFYSPVFYGLDSNGFIDYEEVEALAKKHRPKLIIAGYSAYSRIIDWQRFADIAHQVGAYLVADIAHIAGLVVTGLHPSPVDFADVITTTTHKTLRGPRGGLILAKNATFAKQKKLNSAVFPGLQGGPLVQMIATKAAAFYEALQPEFADYQKQVVRNAQVMVEALQARRFPIVSEGTDNHLFLIDLSQKNISGQKAQVRLEAAHIIANKNMLPNDLKSPHETSGLRLGTPAITTRHFKDQEARQVAHWIADLLDQPEDHNKVTEVRQNVMQLCQDFPIYRF